MRYSNIDYNVLYVDPSRATNGTGATPADALNALPASAGAIPDNTCYIVRRTAEAKACALPTGTNASVANLMVLGMPIPADAMWELVPEEARSAWGQDEALYANVQATASNASLQLPNVEQFVLHRVYLCRNGVDAGAYLLRFDADAEGTACLSFDHCKFGARGVDVDLPSYAAAVTSPRLCGYVRIGRARMVGVTDCTVNHALCGYSSYPHGIHCVWADIMDVEDVRVFSPAWTSSSQAYPLLLSEDEEKGVECTVRNVEQTVRLNGASGQYVPALLSVRGYVSLRLENVSAKTGTPLVAARPSSYQTPCALLSLQSVYEIAADGIDLEYADCWNCRSPVLQFSNCYGSTFVPGCDKHVRNVKVALARESGIGSSLSYSDASYSGSSYAAVSLEFRNDEADVRAKVVQVDGITVLNPRGKALFAESVRLTGGEFEGSIHLRGTVADVKSVTTWFPGKAVNVYDGAHVRVRRLVCNLENPDYPYNEDPAVGTGFSDNGNVFVDESNTSLRPMAASTSTADHVYQGVGCNNEGAEGHFAYRCANGLCDTWSVHREGGGASALKLYNNSCPGGGTMVLGRRPFNGMQLLPKTAGRHILRAHVAVKGYAKPSELYRHLVVSAETGGRIRYSTLHGRWADDSASVWRNDSELTQLVLEMPLDIPDVQPVDVRVYFSWYAAAGFVYLDPDVELVEA